MPAACREPKSVCPRGETGWLGALGAWWWLKLWYRPSLLWALGR